MILCIWRVNWRWWNKSLCWQWPTWTLVVAVLIVASLRARNKRLGGVWLMHAFRSKPAKTTWRTSRVGCRPTATPSSQQAHLEHSRVRLMMQTTIGSSNSTSSASASMSARNPSRLSRLISPHMPILLPRQFSLRFADPVHLSVPSRRSTRPRVEHKVAAMASVPSRRTTSARSSINTALRFNTLLELLDLSGLSQWMLPPSAHGLVPQSSPTNPTWQPNTRALSQLVQRLFSQAYAPIRQRL